MQKANLQICEERENTLDLMEDKKRRTTNLDQQAMMIIDQDSQSEESVPSGNIQDKNEGNIKYQLIIGRMLLYRPAGGHEGH